LIPNYHTMQIESSDLGNVVVVKVSGRMDAANAHEFQGDCDSWISLQSRAGLSCARAQAVKDLKPKLAVAIRHVEKQSAWAEQGWDVTGFDISAEGIAAARRAAEKKCHDGTVILVEIRFRLGQWDRIVFSYAFAPCGTPNLMRAFMCQRGGRA
jgi:hypothetical protein